VSNKEPRKRYLITNMQYIIALFSFFTALSKSISITMPIMKKIGERKRTSWQPYNILELLLTTFMASHL